MIEQGGIYVFEHGDYSDHFEAWYWHSIAGMEDIEVRFLLNDHWPAVRKNVDMQKYPADRGGQIDLWEVLLQQAGFVKLQPAVRVDTFSDEHAYLPEITPGYNAYAMANMEAHIRGKRYSNAPRPGRAPVMGLERSSQAASEAAVAPAPAEVAQPPYVPKLHGLSPSELEKWRARFHDLEAIRDGGPVSETEQAEAEARVYRCAECGVRRDVRFPPHKCKVVLELEAIQGSWPNTVAPL